MRNYSHGRSSGGLRVYRLVLTIFISQVINFSSKKLEQIAPVLYTSILESIIHNGNVSGGAYRDAVPKLPWDESGVSGFPCLIHLSSIWPQITSPVPLHMGLNLPALYGGAMRSRGVAGSRLCGDLFFALFNIRQYTLSTSVWKVLSSLDSCCC